MGLVNRVVAPPTLEAAVGAFAADIARSPRGGLTATKQIVAAIRAGARGARPRATAPALRTTPRRGSGSGVREPKEALQPPYRLRRSMSWSASRRSSSGLSGGA